MLFLRLFDTLIHYFNLSIKNEAYTKKQNQTSDNNRADARYVIKKSG